jgi:hypothetical protein
MDRSLLRREVLPFLATFALLILVTLVSDLVLHQLRLVWVGRYLGIPGTIMILASFLYSMRKRKLIGFGDPRRLLALHETLTWLGSLMVLIHAGVHFTSILPWLALAAMLVNVGSGLTGKFLLDRSRRHMESRKDGLRDRGLSVEDLDKELFWDAVTLDVMKKWRLIHFPITLAFSVLALGHILSVFLFWQWK